MENWSKTGALQKMYFKIAKHFYYIESNSTQIGKHILYITIIPLLCYVTATNRMISCYNKGLLQFI